MIVLDPKSFYADVSLLDNYKGSLFDFLKSTDIPQDIPILKKSLRCNGYINKNEHSFSLFGKGKIEFYLNIVEIESLEKIENKGYLIHNQKDNSLSLEIYINKDNFDFLYIDWFNKKIEKIISIESIKHIRTHEDNFLERKIGLFSVNESKIVFIGL